MCSADSSNNARHGRLKADLCAEKPSSNSSAQHPSLFRAEAAEARASESSWSATWIAPSSRWVAALVFSLVCVGVVGASQLEYADKVTALGWTVPGVRAVNITSPTAGVVSVLSVSHEQQVVKEQVLVRIEKSSRDAGGVRPAQRQLVQLRAQQQQLKSSWLSQKRVWQQQSALLEARLSALADDLAVLNQQVALSHQKLALARHNEVRAQSLANSGYISQRDIERLVTQRLEGRSEVLAYQRQQTGKQADQRNIQVELELIAAQIQADESRFLSDAQKLAQQIEQLMASRAIVLIAPKTGVVMNLSVHEGQSVAPGQILLSLLPNSSRPHQVEAELASHAASRVQRGMQARLRYRGYPFQRFGSGLGRVTRVSQVASGERLTPGFRAAIDVLDLPEGVTEVPAGMTVEVDILLSKAALWQRLVTPLVQTWSRL